MASAPGGTGTGSAGSSAVADEARSLAEQLHRLADAAASSALAHTRPPPQSRSCGVSTEVGGAELSEWAEAEDLLVQAQADIERLREQAAASRARAGRLAAETAEAEAEEQRWIAAAGEAAAAEMPGLEARSAEATAQEAAVAELRRRAAEAEGEAEGARRADASGAEEERRTLAALQEELAESESASRQARGQAAELTSGAPQGYATAAGVLSAAEEAEEKGDVLAEERARLDEELGRLRFSLKDMKSFQHRRSQELNAQVQSLERQRRKLENEQAARAKSECAASAASSEASGAQVTEDQLSRLRQLNALLTSQVQEAAREEEACGRQQVELLAERASLRTHEAGAAAEVDTAYQRLDELAESEGKLRRETRELRNKAHLLQKQVASIGNTASHTSLQLEEAEASHHRLREEEQATERRAEIIGWKLQVAQTQLSQLKRGTGTRRASPPALDHPSSAATSSAPTPGQGSPSGAHFPSAAAADAASSGSTPPGAASADASRMPGTARASAAAGAAAADSRPEVRSKGQSHGCGPEAGPRPG